MKKKLNIGGITNELEGASLFFAKSPPSAPKTSEVTLPESPTTEQTQIQTQQETSKRKIDNTVPTAKPKPAHKDVMNESLQASNNASMHASNQPLTHETIIETIRKAVKDVGKDSATYRFTPEEKKALLELSFSYKMQGYKTSENELIRIAINFMLEDQKQNGRNSVLQRVLDALRK
jgi:hypothetical protein